MKISVIVPVFNEEEYIEKCLISLKNQIEPAFEIIVVDNNCTDKTIDIAKKYNVKIIKEKIPGIRPARDAGFNAAKGEILAKTDADTILPADWTKRIRESFEKDSTLLGLSGTGHYYDVPDILQHKNWIATSAPKFVKFFMKHDGMLGFNLALRKKTWDIVKDEVCLDDKEMHEDADLAIHIAKYGKVFFDKEIIVETSLRQLKRKKELIDYLLVKSLKTVWRKKHFRDI